MSIAFAALGFVAGVLFIVDGKPDLGFLWLALVGAYLDLKADRW